MAFDNFLNASKKKLESSIGKNAQAELNSVTGSNGSPSKLKNTVPWSNTNPNEGFFPDTPLDGSRWNKFYPYRLLVVDATNNRVIQGNSPAGTGKLIVEGGDSGPTTIKLENPGDKWIYTFPISPQQLDTNTSFAINVTAAQQGVNEEHGGVYFKDISISGTTGILPSRASIDTSSGSNNKGFISQIFESTVDAAQKLKNAANVAKKSFSGASLFNKPKNGNPTEEQFFDTGYYQAMYLSRFLEQYAIAKKNPANTNWRLVYHNQKDNEAYVVTPLGLNIKRSAQDPMKYFYSIRMKAWRRLTGLETGVSTKPKIGPNTQSFYQRAFNAIQSTRSLLSSSLNLIKAVRSDFNRPFEILRQGTLLIRDAAGIVKTAADLPNSIIDDAKGTLAQAAVDLQVARSFLQSAAETSGLGGSFRLKANSIMEKNMENEGITFSKAGSPNASGSEIDPSLNPFRSPEGNFDFLNSIDVSTIQFNSTQLEAIERDEIIALNQSADEIRGQASELRSLAFDISNQFGAGDPAVYRILGLPAPIVRATEMTIDELVILNSLYDVINIYEELTSTTDLDDSRILNPIQFTQNLANENGLSFASAQSKLLVPVPFGETLEQISFRYLEDASRWIEIATLNGLREPYIDEAGFVLPLLSNGDDRQFTVSKDARLYVGQRITLSSLAIPKFTRRIINLEDVGLGVQLITVDGNPDLSVLKTNQKATIKASLPGTVNSQDQIFIPIESSAPNTDKTVSPFAFAGDPFVNISKVDILVGEDGDIKLDPSGDFRLAAGLTNLVQALRTMFSTKRGDVFSEPNLGLDVSVGDSSSELQVSEILKNIDAQVSSDSRFSGLNELEVVLDGPALSIKLAAEVAGGSGVVPINFALKR